ncbi:histidine decarboxylase [Allocatelliglobosispora scoriae]|uniref:Histidine decarboxylase n=1 Tax=Allocatelliglobosispora scoriae TaxID=643052 RepID=A0A841BQ46_9ACTN|nr:histidine decarboxylase [Allocatelliglobosispora scoriae]MBB5868882.1 histidine decarboxylase [Allocatelliglobosispora scoriae]
MLGSLDVLANGWAEGGRRAIGFPGATDMSFPHLAEVLTGQPLNNVGDPWTEGLYANHSKPLERFVIDTIAGLLRAPEQHWGYVTPGASEGTLAGLLEARTRYPDAVVYHSSAAHNSVRKAARILSMPAIEVRAVSTGEMDYPDLARQVGAHRDRAVIVVANVGTTMTEAVDDLRVITQILDQQQVTRRFIHCDAALTGIPLALLPAKARPGFDFADGADSIVVSGHKFLGVPMPCGIFVARRDRQPVTLLDPVSYTGVADTPIGCSRNGHTPLYIAHVLHSLGVDGLRRRADDARVLAAYAQQRLANIGWHAWRHPYAFTVVLDTPPTPVERRWNLPSEGGWSHVICMPGVTVAQIDEFVADIATAVAGPRKLAPAHQAPEQSLVVVS